MADIFDLAFGKALDAAGPGASASGDVEPSRLFDALISQESGGKQFDKNNKPLTSSAGAIGRAQVMPGTAPIAAKLAGLEYDEIKYRTDPAYNEALGRAYFNQQLQDFDGDAAKALAAYNAGPQRLRNALTTAEKNGNPDAWLQYLPRETQAYVPSVFARAGSKVPAGQNREFLTPTGREYVSQGKSRESATIGDLGKELAASAIEGVGSIGQFAGEGMAAVANRISGTEDYQGKNLLKPASESIRGTMTEGGQQARQGANVEGSVSDLISGNAKLPDNVDSWLMLGANGFGSLLSSVVPLAGPAGRVASLTKAARAAELAGDTAKAAELVQAAQSAARTSKAIGAASGGAMTGGAAAGEVRETASAAVGKMSHEQLMQQVPAYAEAFNATGDQDQARQAVVNSAARWAGGLSSIAGAAGGAFNAKVIEDFLTHKGMSAMIGDSLASRSGRAAVGGAGGMTAEGLQEGTEKAGQNAGENIALGRGVMDDVLRNTAGDVLGGALVGGPVGLTGGAFSKPSEPKPTPNPLQSVVDQAQKPGSVLSRAVVATGAPDQAAAQAQAETSVDPISARVGAVESQLQDGMLDKIRGFGPDTSGEFLYALNVAKNPNTRADMREKAITQVEQVLQTAQSGTGFTMVPPEKKEPSTALTVPPAQRQPGTDLMNPNGGPVAPNGMGQFFDPNTVDVDAVRVDNMIGGPRALPAPTRALPGPAASQEQSGPAQASVASPVSQQNVADVTGTVAPVSPEAQATAQAAAKDVPAANRKRANTLRQLAENGYETVERRGSDFYLRNSKTGQELKLDGMADAAMARKAINDLRSSIAGQSPNSPQNDKKQSSQAQNEANNYFQPEDELNGRKIRYENDKGSIRSGVDKDGKAWSVTMGSKYGKIVGIKGADKDALDVLVGDRADSPKIFVIDQVNPDGSFDEHKVVFGATSEDTARQTYLSNYSKGWTGLGAITEMTREQFDNWVKPGKVTKPVGLGKAKPAEAKTASTEKVADSTEKQGQFATLEEAKAYLSAQRRANGNMSGLPLQMADGSFGVAAKGTPQYAEAERQRDEREGANKQVEGKSKGTLFTVKDGGKQRKLKKVSKGSMPKKSSARREGKSILRTLSQDEASAIEQMAAILGKKVEFYEVADNGGRLADGFVNPGEPNVIYVATETTVNPVAIFGHEFYHTLRETNPAAWNAIAAVVRKRVKDAKGFRADYYGEDVAEQRGDAELDMEQGGELEELISDLGGNLMMDAGFWGEVFGQIQKDNGKDAKGIIARLAAAIEQMVARVMAAVNQGGFAANDFVDDMAAIRAEFAKALAGHIQKAGISKSGMDAEIKKSVIRVSAEQKALEEFAEVDAKYRGTDQWMKAPNGQATQLSERQWIQVRTPSFKAWFGDWEAFAVKQGGVWNDDKGEVSKVVDDNGEPLVVYHGTSKGGFSEFKTPGGKVRGDLGIFTTPNLEMAKTYNKRGSTKEIKFSDMERDAIEGGDTPGFYASFVSIRNPYETDFAGALWNGERPEQWVVVDEEGITQYDSLGNEFFDSEEKAQEFADSVGGEVQSAPDHWETTDGAVSEARSNRNDGAIIRSVIDDGGGYSSYFNEPSDVYVALDPNQLKSATQNTGEFGKRTDDMRFSRDRAASDVDPDGYNEFTATPEDVALADAYEAKHGIRPYITAGQLQVPVKLPNIRKSVKRAYAEKDLAKGRENHPILGVPLNKNGTVTLYFPTTNDDARRVARERTLKAAAGSNRVYLTNESSADVVASRPGNISLLGDDVQANVMIHVDPSLLQIDTEHADGRIDFFIPVAEGNAFKGKMSQVKLFNMFAERAEPITREKTLKDIERSIEEAMKRIDKMPEGERKKLVTKAKAVLKQEHNVGTLLTENGKLQKTRAGEYDLKHYEGDSVASLGLGLASAQQITEKLSSCPQHANCESLCLGDTSGQNLLYGGEGPFRAGPRLSQYLKTEAMVLHPEEFALVLHNEIKLLEGWARKETGFETTVDEETGDKVKTPKQLYQPSIRLNVTSDFRPVTWAPIIKAMPGVEFYDYTKLDTKPISKNHHLTYSSDGVAQVVDGVAIGNGNYNWDRMLRQMRNGFNVAMAFSDKNEMPKFLVDGSTGERFQVWNGDNYDARFLDPKPGQEGNLFNKGMIIGLTNKDRTKSGLAIALGKQGPASSTKAEWKKLINEIASDERFINDKSVPYVLKWVSNQKGEIDRKALIKFADSPAVKHNGFFMDYDPKRDGDTVVVADQERTKEAYKSQQPKVFEVARFSRDRSSDTYNQRVSALKDLISCLKK